MGALPMTYRQYLQGEQALEPEEVLLGAVLKTALLDIKGKGWRAEQGKFTKKHKKTKAVYWILSDSIHCSPQKGISFRFICEALELDAVRIRENVYTRFQIKQDNLSYEIHKEQVARG